MSSSRLIRTTPLDVFEDHPNGNDSYTSAGIGIDHDDGENGRFVQEKWWKKLLACGKKLRNKYFTRRSNKYKKF